MEKQDGKYLSFELADQIFAVNIARVSTILNDFGRITAVPEFPEYSSGVINLRGEIVPVINARMRFGKPALPAGHDTRTECIIVAETTCCKGANHIGFLVDNVNFVADYEGKNFSPVPVLTAKGSEFLEGMYKAEDKIILVIDIDNLVGEKMAAAVDDYMEKMEHKKSSD